MYHINVSFIIDIIVDATLLILTYGSKDRWSDLVSDPANDLFSTTAMGDIGSSKTIAELISRIKQGRYMRL